MVTLAPARAADQLSLSVAELDGAGWAARDVRIDLDAEAEKALGVAIGIGQLTLPEPIGTVPRLQFTCAHLRMVQGHVACRHGELTVDHPLLAGARLSAEFRFDTNGAKVNAGVRLLASSGGRFDVRLDGGVDRWTLRGEFAQASAAELVARVRSIAPLPVSAGAGRVEGWVELGGSGGQVQQIAMSLRGLGLMFDHEQAAVAAEGLDTRFDLDAVNEAGVWRASASVRFDRGALLAGPYLLEPRNGVALASQAELRWAPHHRELELSSLSFDYPGVLSLSARARLALRDRARLLEGSVQVPVTPIGAAFDVFVRPLLIGTALEQLGAEGQVGVEAHFGTKDRGRIGVVLGEVTVRDARDRYVIEGLNGHLGWNTAAQDTLSLLHWRGGRVFGLPFGAASTRLVAQGDGVHLEREVEIPVLNGGLVISSLRIIGLTTGDLQARMDGHLRPIRLQPLMEAIGLPPFAGTLSAMVPDTTFSGDTLEVNGALLLSVFDGDVIVRDLRLQDPLGALPVLTADIQLRALDLEALTRTFSFGRIEGRLEGKIARLRLERWYPIGFDARLASPPGGRAPRRISQRAIDNLSSLGAPGIRGALSRSVLRVFSEFRYDRLGLSCRLVNGTCEMGGIAPAPGGYYIVKGGGVPRIDVIGYHRRVDWDELVRRLRAATAVRPATP